MNGFPCIDLWTKTIPPALRFQNQIKIQQPTYMYQSNIDKRKFQSAHLHK